MPTRSPLWTMGGFEPLRSASVFHAESRYVAGGADDPNPEAPNNVAVVCGPQYGPVMAATGEEGIPQSLTAGYEHLLLAGFSCDGAVTGILRERVEPANSRRTVETPAVADSLGRRLSFMHGPATCPG